MCGLAGGFAANQFSSYAEIETLRQLGLLACLRGTDSGGVAVGKVTNKGNVGCTFFKDTKTLGHMMYTDADVNRALTTNNKNERLKFVIGHARAATQGAVNAHNAHPHFTEDKNIVGVHNGTIPAFAKKDDPNHSDSRQLFNMIATEGLAATVEAAGFEGAMALVWYNHKEKTLNFYRNHHRPLYYAECGGDFYWSSEPWMLEKVGQRSDTVILRTPTLLATDTHFTYHIPSNQRTQVEVRRKFVPYTTPTQGTTLHGEHGTNVWRAAAAERLREAHRAKNVEPSHIPLPGLGSALIPLSEEEKGKAATSTLNDCVPDMIERGGAVKTLMFLDWKKKPIALVDARYYLGSHSGGCVSCGEHSDPLTDVIYWVQPGQHICSSCKDYHWMGEMLDLKNAVRGEKVYV